MRGPKPSCDPTYHAFALSSYQLLSVMKVNDSLRMGTKAVTQISIGTNEVKEQTRIYQDQLWHRTSDRRSEKADRQIVKLTMNAETPKDRLSTNTGRGSLHNLR